MLMLLDTAGSFDWLALGEKVLTVAGAYYGIHIPLVAAQAAIGTVTGKDNRHSENVGTVLSPKASWPSTWKALTAILFGWHSPKESA